jgi:hypothetical protein
VAQNTAQEPETDRDLLYPELFQRTLWLAIFPQLLQQFLVCALSSVGSNPSQSAKSPIRRVEQPADLPQTAIAGLPIKLRIY